MILYRQLSLAVSFQKVCDIHKSLWFLDATVSLDFGYECLPSCIVKSFQLMQCLATLV